jgi:hypothetical protein
VHQALGEQDTGQITPHSFRHYFVTIVLRASGNLKLAQELARRIPTSRPRSSTPTSATTNSTGGITTFSRRTCNLTEAVLGYTVRDERYAHRREDSSPPHCIQRAGGS